MNTVQSTLDRIIDGIAGIDEVDPDQLVMSLEQHISTDAIEELVAHEGNAWRLQFETSTHIVEVTGNDEILIDGTPVNTLI